VNLIFHNRMFSKEAIALEQKRRLFTARIQHNPERYTPYKMIWLKVIIRAVYDYVMWRNSPKVMNRKLADDAARWLFEPSMHANGFEYLCEIMSLPQNDIRKWARRLTPDDVQKLELKERDNLLGPMGCGPKDTDGVDR
jgi:hypothetical protein